MKPPIENPRGDPDAWHELICASFTEPERILPLRQRLIAQEFRSEPPSKRLVFARWLYQHGIISG